MTPLSWIHPSGTEDGPLVLVPTHQTRDERWEGWSKAPLGHFFSPDLNLHVTEFTHSAHSAPLGLNKRWARPFSTLKGCFNIRGNDKPCGTSFVKLTSHRLVIRPEKITDLFLLKGKKRRKKEKRGRILALTLLSVMLRYWTEEAVA